MKKFFTFLIITALLLTNCGIENTSSDEPDAPVTDEPAEITTPDIAELSVPALENFEFEYEIISSSDAAFEAGVRIINMNREAISGWKLTFDGGFSITETRSAKLIDSNGANHAVINEFWTSAINPHSSAIFTFTAEKPAGAEIILENFALFPYDAPAETPAPIELSPITLRGLSELGYNVLVWDFNHNVDSYTIFRNSEEIATVSGQNFYFDRNVEENQSYTYFIVQLIGREFETSDQVSITTTLDEPEGFSAWQNTLVLENDSARANLRISYQHGDSEDHVSKDLILPEAGVSGSQISWLSSNEQIINNHGEIVNRPTGGFFPVTLTAVLQYDEYILTREFEINIAPTNNANIEKMTLEILEELNNGELPVITFRDSGDIWYIETNRIAGSPQSIISSFPVFNPEDALIVINSYLNVFKIYEDINVEFDRLSGITHNSFNFSQYHKGIRVMGAGFTINADKDTGRVIFISSSYVKDIDINIEPNISQEEAKEIILLRYNVTILEREPHLIIDYNHNTKTLELTWVVHTGGEISEVFINAHSGDIIGVESLWAGF
jgi:hypothetical protein